MKFKEYNKLTSQFNCYPKEDMKDALILGIAEEVLEYQITLWGEDPAESLKELGDIFWYCSEWVNNYIPEEEISKVSLEINLLATSKELISCVKKFKRGDFSEEEQIQRVSSIVLRILSGVDTKDTCLLAMDENIKKLTDRKERNVIKGEGDNR